MEFSELVKKFVFWDLHFSRYMGTKTAIIFRGFRNLHINIFWFLNYHPEDTRHAPQRIVDDPSEFSVLFLESEGFNLNLRDSLLEIIKKEDK